MTLLSAPRHFRRSDAVPRKSMNSERKREREREINSTDRELFAIINQHFLSVQRLKIHHSDLYCIER